MFTLGLVSCSPNFEGDEPGECSDAADNDRDGAFDCDDEDCASSPACAETSDEDTGLGDTGATDTAANDTDDSCDNPVLEMYPPDGSSNVYYRTAVEVEFRMQEEGASIEVTDGDGRLVPGETTWEGAWLHWSPIDPLRPLSTYKVEAESSCPDEELAVATWATSAVGTELQVQPGSLDGRTYWLDFESARFTEPRGIADVIGDQLDQIVFFNVSSPTAVEFQGTFVYGYRNTDDGGNASDGLQPTDDPGHSDTMSALFQEPCLATGTLPTSVEFEDPYFHWRRESVPNFEVTPFPTFGFCPDCTVDLKDLSVSGAFTPDASAVHGMRIRYTMDLRTVVPLMFEGCDEPTLEDGSPNPDYPCDESAACDTLAFVAECEPCDTNNDAADSHCGWTGGYDENGQGQGTYGDACCMTFAIDSLRGEQVHYANDSWFTTESYSQPPADDSYCQANPAICGGLDECE